MSSFKKWSKRLIAAAAAAVVVLLTVVLVNTLRVKSRQIRVAAVAADRLDEAPMLDRFSRALQLPTISVPNPARLNEEPFRAFAQLVEEAYPRLHREPVTRYTGDDFGDDRNLSLLFQWPGSDPQLRPVLLMAHYDVVPVEAATFDQWEHPPFSGRVGDDFVWGRGTLDVKDGAMALLEAMNHLLDSSATPFQPRRTVYVSLGHDEEVGGLYGNKLIAEWMRSRGIRLEFVLDEGGCIYRGFPGLDRDVALIGVAEKGFLNLRLVVEVEDTGHSSMPPQETAIAILAAALTRLQRDPFPRRLDGGADLMLSFIGPETNWTSKMAAANPWLFAPLIKRQLGAQPSGDASIRTTMAMTTIQGGVKDNVLPALAEANVNLRILPGETVDTVATRVRRVINDARVQVELVTPHKEPSRISSLESEGFETIHTTVKQVFSDVLVAPFVLVGGTDAAHFDDISGDIYRFIPARLDETELKRIHGINERIAREDYLNIIRFYLQLIRNL